MLLFDHAMFVYSFETMFYHHHVSCYCSCCLVYLVYKRLGIVSAGWIYYVCPISTVSTACFISQYYMPHQKWCSNYMTLVTMQSSLSCTKDEVGLKGIRNCTYYFLNFTFNDFFFPFLFPISRTAKMSHSDTLRVVINYNMSTVIPFWIKRFSQECKSTP